MTAASLIVRTAARLLVPLLLLTSLVVLGRGHHEPGGGFIGGLVAAGGLALHGLAFGRTRTRRLLRIRPQTLIGAGLAVALGSALPSVLRNQPFGTASWVEVVGITLGTPLVFDFGVYLTVIGFAATLLDALEGA